MIEYICNLHPQVTQFCAAVSDGNWWLVTKYVLFAAAAAGAYFTAQWLKNTKKWTKWLGDSNVETKE